MYNNRLVGSRPALSGDTVSLIGTDNQQYCGVVIQDGCTRSLVQFGRDYDWYDNDYLTLEHSNPHNTDYLA